MQVSPDISVGSADPLQLKPIYLFLDLLGFALELKTTSIAPHIIDSLVPLVQRTADLVAIPRFNSASPDQYLKAIDVYDSVDVRW